MDAFLTGIVGYPTVIFTVLLAVAFLYWLFVVLGAFDVDVLGSGDGAADGLAEGAADGLAEGAADGLAEGAADGLVDAGAEGVADAAGHSVGEGAAHGTPHGAEHGGFGFLSGLKLRSAPLTVVLSVLVLSAWALSYLGMRVSSGALPGVPTWLLGTVVLVLAFGLGLLVTSLAIRPLGPLFKTHQAPSRTDIIGGVCIVRTGKVTSRFGQARHEAGGNALLIDIRCDEPNRLRRGKEALIIAFDETREAFVVEPMEPLLALPAERTVDSEEPTET